MRQFSRAWPPGCDPSSFAPWLPHWALFPWPSPTAQVAPRHPPTPTGSRAQPSLGCVRILLENSVSLKEAYFTVGLPAGREPTRMRRTLLTPHVGRSSDMRETPARDILSLMPVAPTLFAPTQAELRPSTGPRRRVAR